MLTPWTAPAEVDYERLVAEFGLSRVDERLLRRLEAAAGEPPHRLLRRGFYFAHRDLDRLLHRVEAGEAFAVYTGRGPSGPVHLGHLVGWELARWFQRAFDAEVIFQVTDDEKFLFRSDLSLEDAEGWSRENALDFLALGFEQGKTWVLQDTRHAGLLYPEAVRVARHVTLNQARSTFGFTGSANVGQPFFPAMQAVPAFLPSIRAARDVPCLILMGVDQDPHARLTRDVAPRLGYPKPATLESRFAPALSNPAGKMSASEPRDAIFAADPPEVVERKVKRCAHSGGQPTVEAHRRLGGNPDADTALLWLGLLLHDDLELAEVREAYRRGDLLSGDVKNRFIEHATVYLAEHRERRERVDLDAFFPGPDWLTGGA